NVSAHSFTGGVVYRPGDSPGFHLGAHYWRVVMDNRIVIPTPADIQALEGTGRVSRSAPTEADRLAGWAGAIESLDASLLNYGRLQTSGIDLDLSYRVSAKLGSVQAALSATWVDEYVSQDLTPVQQSDRVAVASVMGTIPEWRLVGTLAWQGIAWGASTTTT